MSSKDIASKIKNEMNLLDFSNNEIYQGINPRFSKFEDSMIIYGYGKDHRHTEDYSLANEKQLVSKCLNHRNKHVKKISGKNVVILVHPFYVKQHDPGKERGLYSEVCNAYFNRIKILFQELPRSKYAIVAAEMPESYSKFSSFLMEEGYIDDVVFTKFGTGYPLDTRDMRIFFGASKIYLAGGIKGRKNDQCFDAFKETFCELYSGIKNPKEIPNLVLPWYDSLYREHMHKFLAQTKFNIPKLDNI